MIFVLKVAYLSSSPFCIIHATVFLLSISNQIYLFVVVSHGKGSCGFSNATMRCD